MQTCALQAHIPFFRYGLPYLQTPPVGALGAPALHLCSSLHLHVPVRKPPRSHTDTQVWVPATAPCAVTAIPGCRLLVTPTGRMLCLALSEVMVSVEWCQCQPGFDCCCLYSKVSFLPVTNFHAFFFRMMMTPLFQKSLCNSLVTVEPGWWWLFFSLTWSILKQIPCKHSYFNMLSKPFAKGGPCRQPHKEHQIISCLSLSRIGNYLEAILQRKGRMAPSETHYINKLSWLQRVRSLSPCR